MWNVEKKRSGSFKRGKRSGNEQQLITMWGDKDRKADGEEDERWRRGARWASCGEVEAEAAVSVLKKPPWDLWTASIIQKLWIMGQLAEVGEQMRDRQFLQEDQSERFKVPQAARRVYTPHRSPDASEPERSMKTWENGASCRRTTLLVSRRAGRWRSPTWLSTAERAERSSTRGFKLIFSIKSLENSPEPQLRGARKEQKTFLKTFFRVNPSQFLSQSSQIFHVSLKNCTGSSIKSKING